MDTQMEIIIGNEDFTRKLATALDGSNSSTVKKQIFELLSELCRYSSDGYKRALDALQQYKEVKKCRYRFNLLVEELRNSPSQSYSVAVIDFINSIIASTDKLSDRVRIRNEFIGLKLPDVLNHIRNLDDLDPDLQGQVNIFDQDKANDDEQLAGPDGVDLNSHSDVFQAVLKQVLDTPQEVSFLATLQHLLQVDPQDPTSDLIWDTIEKLVCRATYLEKKQDADMLLITGGKRLEKAISGSGISEDGRCTCTCHLNEDGRSHTDSTSSADAPSAPPPPPPPPVGHAPPPPPPPPPGPGGAPPPPPPPPPGGVPPPPGGPPTPGLVPPPPAIKLPQQNTPKPKSKMKKFQWNKIPPQRVMGKKNLWTSIGNMINSYKVDFDQMEEMFAHKAPKETIRSNDTTDGQPAEKKKKDEINLLDGKRSLNVNIFLRQFKIPHQEIVQLLANGESGKFGAEKLKGLLKILPENDEIEMLRTFDGDKSKLGNAEKFFIEILGLPNYKLRNEALLMREEFNNTMDFIKPSIHAIKHSAEHLKSSKEIHEIFYLVLIAGNFLNAGGYSGDAAGFKLSSLLKLTDLRGNKPGTTLLHYVVGQVEEKNPRLFELPTHMIYLKEAAQVSMDALNAEIKTVRDKLISISEQMKDTEEEFQGQMKSFLSEAKGEMEKLEVEQEKLETLRKDLASYFCEDESTFKLEDCLQIFSTFIDKFVKAIEENKQRRLQEEKAEQRRKQREEQQQQGATLKKRGSGEFRPGSAVRMSSGSDESDTNIVDCLLSDSESLDLPPGEFTRSGSLRGSKRGSIVANRLHAIEESDGQQSKSDDEGSRSRTRPSSDKVESEQLMDYLLQVGDDSDQGNLERQNSLRRSRRRKNNHLDALVIDRERAPSPSTATSSSTTPQGTEPKRVRPSSLEKPDYQRDTSPRNSTATPSPLITDTPKSRFTLENENRLSAPSATSSENDSNSKDDDSPNPRAQRRRERYNRNALQISDMNDGFAERSSINLPSDRTIPEVCITPDTSDSPSFKSNDSHTLTTSYSSDDLSTYSKQPFERTRKTQSFRHRREYDQSEIASTLSTIDEQSKKSESLLNRANAEKASSSPNSLERSRSRYGRLNTPDVDVTNMNEKNAEKHTDVDTVIRQVERTGREIELMGKEDKEENTRSWLSKHEADVPVPPPRSRSKSDVTNEDSKGTPSKALRPYIPEEREHKTASEKAWLEHSMGRWKSNIDKNDVDEAFKNIKESQRPTSTYDNVNKQMSLADVPRRRESQERVSESRESVSESASTPQSPNSKRWGRYLEDLKDLDSTGPQDHVSIASYATLPRTGRHYTALNPNEINAALQKIEPASPSNSDDPGYHSLDRQRMSRRSLRQLNSASFPLRTDIENQEISQKVNQFQISLSEEEKMRRKQRFGALSARYSNNDDGWSPPTSTFRPNSGDLSDGPLIIDGPLAALTDKAETDSIGKDEGFETESMSDPSGSQRTSMSSTLDSELPPGTPTFPKKEFNNRASCEALEESSFARSIDSLVQSKSADEEEALSAKTPTSEDSRIGVWTDPAESSEKPTKAIPNTLNINKKAVRKDSGERPPTPPERTTSIKPGKPSLPTSSARKPMGPSSRTTTPASRRSAPVTSRSDSGDSNKSSSSSSKLPTSSNKRQAPTAGRKVNNTAAQVTARLTASRNNKKILNVPSTLTRHASNSSIGSENSSTSATTKRNTKSRLSTRSPLASQTSLNRNSSSRSSGETTPSTPSTNSNFVRGSATRKTIPAAMFRSNKKTAAELREERNVPAPPTRSTSIRASSRASMTLARSPKVTEPINSFSSSTLPTRPRRHPKTSASFTARDLHKPEKTIKTVKSAGSSPTKTPSKARPKDLLLSDTSPLSSRASSKEIIDISPADLSKSKKSPSLLRLIDKSDYRKSDLNKSNSFALERKNTMPVLRSTTKASKC